MTSPARTLEDVRSIVPPSLWDRAWRPFWVLPLAISLTCALAGIFLPQAEQPITEHLPFVFEGGPDGARTVLSTIASAMISVTGLVFSITMVVLQLASSQFTPRVLSTFLASRVTQTTLGVFTGTFIYALAVLRSVRGQDDAFVPQLSVTLAFVLVLASVAMFLAFIHHITTSIQVAQVIARIGTAARRAVDDLYPEQPGSGPQVAWEAPTGTEPRWLDARDRTGHVTHVDHEHLVTTAQAADAVVEILVPIGEVVVERQPLARVWGLETDLATGELFDDVQAKESRSVAGSMAGDIGVARARSQDQDLALSIRQLVDIAERALSPGINDPTTAVQVIDQLHRILRLLVTRETPSPCVVDEEGTVRVVQPVRSIGSLIDLSVEEICHYGTGSVQVPRRMEAMLTDLRRAARPEQRERLDHWLGRLSAD